MTNHEEIKQLLPLAALDQLEPEDAAVLDDHLRICDDCPAELQAYRAAAAAIPLADERAIPHDHIWARLQTRLGAEGRLNASNASPPHATLASERSPRPTASCAAGWRISTGLATVAAIVIAVYAGLLTARLDQQDTAARARVTFLQSKLARLHTELGNTHLSMTTLQRMLDDRQSLQRVLLASDVKLVRLMPQPAAPNAAAIVLISQSRRAAVIEVRGLPSTPAANIYELWWITKENGPISAGLFTAGGISSVTASISPPPAHQQVLLSAVTLEPLAGVSKPTGAMYLRGAPG